MTNVEGGQKVKEKKRGRASKKASTNKKSKNYKKPYNRQGR
jgi:hypothetical protein